MSNIDVMYSARRELLCRTAYLNMTGQSDFTPRYSAVQNSIFCGSLFQKFEVSYERRSWPRIDQFD
jgi:hypothetical protein